MGRTALLLLTLAAGARAAAPPPGATRAAARFEELVVSGRQEQSELAPLVDELRALSKSYDWERDADKAGKKRADLRGRIEPRLKALGERLTVLSDTLRRFADEHGLETLERLTDERSLGAPDLISIMRAQTFQQQGVIFAGRVEADLRQEEDAWRRYHLIEGERRRFRRILWGLSLTFLAVLAALAYAARVYLRRRRPPTTTRRGGRSGRGGHHGEIIDLRPE